MKCFHVALSVFFFFAHNCKYYDGFRCSDSAGEWFTDFRFLRGGITLSFISVTRKKCAIFKHANVSIFIHLEFSKYLQDRC